MSTNTRTLQKRAASMLINSKHPFDICSRLGIKPNTLERWRGQPHFKELMHTAKMEYKENLEIKMLELTASALSAMRYDWYTNETAGMHRASFILSILEDMKKNKLLSFEMLPNQQESAENGSKNRRNQRELIPNQQELTPNQPKSTQNQQESAAISSP